MTKLFLDTEFSHFEHPQLISLGLVSEDGQHFYAEIERAEWWQYMSTFVEDEVVPLLHNFGHAGEPRAQVGRRLREWLAHQGEGLVVVADFELDWQLLEALLRETGPWPANLENVYEPFDPWDLDTRFEYGCVEVRDQYYELNGLDPHHALNDARALCAAYQHMQRKQEEKIRVFLAEPATKRMHTIPDEHDTPEEIEARQEVLDALTGWKR